MDNFREYYVDEINHMTDKLVNLYFKYRETKQLKLQYKLRLQEQNYDYRMVHNNWIFNDERNKLGKGVNL